MYATTILIKYQTYCFNFLIHEIAVKSGIWIKNVNVMVMTQLRVLATILNFKSMIKLCHKCNYHYYPPFFLFIFFPFHLFFCFLDNQKRRWSKWDRKGCKKEDKTAPHKTWELAKCVCSYIVHFIRIMIQFMIIFTFMPFFSFVIYHGFHFYHYYYTLYILLVPLLYYAFY